MTITPFSGHDQLMVLVFLPRESVRHILAIQFTRAKTASSPGLLPYKIRESWEQFFFVVVYMSVLKSVVLSSLRMKCMRLFCDRNFCFKSYTPQHGRIDTLLILVPFHVRVMPKKT